MGFFTNRKIRQLNKVLERQPGESATILALADDLVRRGKAEEASAALRKLAETADDQGVTAECAVRLGRIALKAQIWQEAREDFEAVLEGPNPYTEEASLGFALAIMSAPFPSEEDMQSAETILAPMNSAALTPGLRRWWTFAQGALLHYQEKHDEAFALLTKLQAEGERSRDWSDTDRLETAIRALALVPFDAPQALVTQAEKALSLAYEDEDRGKVYLAYGVRLVQTSEKDAKEKLESAARYLSASKRTTPDLLLTHLELTQLYLRTHQLAQAAAEAAKGAELSRGMPAWRSRFLELLIEAYDRNQVPVQALSAARELVISAHDAASKALGQREVGRLMTAQGNAQDALPFLREAAYAAVLPGPEQAAATFYLGEALLKLNQHQEALPLLQGLQGKELPEALSLRLYELLGEALLAKGRAVDAAEAFAKVAAEEVDEQAQEIAKEKIKDIRVEVEAGNIGTLLSSSDKAKLDEIFEESIGEVTYFDRLRVGLSKTRDGLVARLETLVSGKTAIDDDMLDEMEEILVGADMGVNTTMAIMDHLRGLIAKKRLTKPEDLITELKARIETILSERSNLAIPIEAHHPFVLMVIGVNGVGKTTTIAKLARRYTLAGKTVLLAAGDTFRAGAIDQLGVWAERVGCELIRHEPGSDPSAVVYDAIHAAQNRAVDLLIIDTAGRLHTKVNLMEELKKMKRIADREMPGTPHETLLVLDGTTGQNAVNQAKIFHEAVPIDGIALTKLDGTAKGGIVVTITHELKIPVKLIGIGEKYDDLRDFNPKEFVDALFAPKPEFLGESSKMASAVEGEKS